MSNDSPVFRYHPDPMSTGALIESSTPCECCGRSRGLLYTGPVFARDEIGPLCPWCIADGSAADRFDAEFTAVDEAPSEVPPAVLEEVLERTPGFTAWQQEEWLFHCSDAAEYLGRVGYEDVAALPHALQMLSDEGWPSDALRAMRADGDLTGYLFRCRHCRIELATADAS